MAEPESVFPEVGQPEVRHNQAAHRFEAGAAPALAILDYRMMPQVIDLLHVEVPKQYQGQGVAGKLASSALEWARENNLKVIPTCPFVKAFLGKHPEFADLAQPQ